MISALLSAVLPASALGMPDVRGCAAEMQQLAGRWMQPAVPARLAPHAPGLLAEQGGRSFSQLHLRANQLARALRQHGLRAGDALALICSNRTEFVEVFLAAMRAGLRLTPINTHLTRDEVQYIVQDSGARLLLAERALGAPGLAPAGVAEVVIGADPSSNYEAFLARGEAADLPDAGGGTLMLYTSGTTGRPKGVRRDEPEIVEPQFAGSFADYQPGDVALCCGPAYHSAPLLFDIRWPLASGVPVVMMAKWDALQALQLIAQHRVTHMHMVPTMFQRLLALPQAQRERFDLSSLRFVVHGAAPCPVPVKRAIIDWFGPVLTEYYAATEGGHGIHVNSQDWLHRPGTVGRMDPALGHRIVGDDGRVLGPGQVGRIFFRAPETGRFEYHGDAEKTAAAYAGTAGPAGEHFTLGDMGYADEEGWLFLTGRAAECIISGGVNIYPREIDEVLLRHSAVADACTVGAPDDEWGERVVAVVVPAEGCLPTQQLAAELSAHAAAHLASFKRPREIVFDTALPHTATGKLQRRLVRARFWQGRGREI